ncbi:LysR family transcriptional regulator [Labrys okinawensis]|uniref:LysR family transcriptional regulator n=1 Tax=Labrys okinawensis TaxID=346911 RepID=A0A2S9QBT9_9HYPH|nr:LysR family transcriptional regulator [Labrys okinawensis]
MKGNIGAGWVGGVAGEFKVGDGFPNLAWDDLRLVKAIADTRNLPTAAARIGIDHSTAFRRLRQIEQTLGVTLFEKHRTGYTLTSAGEEVAGLADRVDEDIVSVLRRLAGSELDLAGELRITTNDTLLVELLTPLLARFAEAYPGMRLDVVLSNAALNLSKRDADIAIRASDAPPDTLVGRRVARIGWALYGRAEDFPEPGLPDLEALHGRRWVALGDNLATLKAVRYVKAHVAPERIVYRVNSVLGLAEAVEAGIGIGHLPCFIAGTRPGLRRIGSVNPEFGADLWLLTHPDLRDAPRIRAFLNFIAAEIVRRRAFIEGT